MPQVLHSTTDTELVAQLESLRGRENATVAQILLHLAELDTRGLYRDLGYSSLFSFCVERLGYSEGSAYRRVQSARMLKTHPEILGLVESGKVSLCSISEISKVMDVAKRAELLNAAVGKTKEAVMQMTAKELPVAILKRESIRAKVIQVSETAEAISVHSDSLELKCAEDKESSSEVPQAKTNIVVYNFTMEVDDEFMRLYREAKEIVGHVGANDVLRRALSEFISNRKEVRRLVKESLEKNSRFIPKATKVEVFKRDGHQCTFVAEDGRRCSERHGLEIDHIKPYAMGGTNGAENLRLLCRTHNRLMAERFFGRSQVLSRIAAIRAA